jgi:hypothetical protein
MSLQYFSVNYSCKMFCNMIIIYTFMIFFIIIDALEKKLEHLSKESLCRKLLSMTNALAYKTSVIIKAKCFVTLAP